MLSHGFCCDFYSTLFVCFQLEKYIFVLFSDGCFLFCCYNQCLHFEAVEQFEGLYKYFSHRLWFSESSELREVHVFMQRPQGRGVGKASFSVARVSVRNLTGKESLHLLYIYAHPAYIQVASCLCCLKDM